MNGDVTDANAEPQPQVEPMTTRIDYVYFSLGFTAGVLAVAGAHCVAAR